MAEPNDSLVVRVYGDTQASSETRGRSQEGDYGYRWGCQRAYQSSRRRSPTGNRGGPCRGTALWHQTGGCACAPRRPCCQAFKSGNLFEEQKVFDVVVWSTPATRHSLSSIRDLSSIRPAAGRCVWATWRRCALCLRRASSAMNLFSRYLDVIADVQGTRSRRRGGRQQPPPANAVPRSNITPRCLATTRTAGCPTARAHLRNCRRTRDAYFCCRRSMGVGVWQCSHS